MRPSSRSRRIRVAVMGAPSISKSSWERTSMPCAPPHRRRSATVPAARAPNLRSHPTCTAAGTLLSNVALRKASGEDPASSAVKGRMATASASSDSSGDARLVGHGASSGVRDGSAPSGSMSKVMTTKRPARRRACSRARSSRKRCPRWTPSNTPKAQLAPANRSSGASMPTLYAAATGHSFLEHARDAPDVLRSVERVQRGELVLDDDRHDLSILRRLAALAHARRARAQLQRPAEVLRRTKSSSSSARSARWRCAPPAAVGERRTGSPAA